MSSPDEVFPGEPDTGPGPPARRPPNWKALVYAAAAVTLLSAGSVIGSAHARSSAHTATVTAAATATVTAAAPAASSAPTVTATVTATVNAATPTVEDVNPLALFAHGTGAGHTPAFISTEITFQVAWNYDCAPTRPVPRFVATLYRNGDNVGLIASHTGPSGQDFIGLPNGQGTFSVVVAAPAGCRWTIAAINW